MDWLRRWALPLWGGTGFHAGPDRFHEALDFDGRPVVDVPQRFRVQGRQIYAFGHATVLGWFDGREIVSRAVQRGIASFRHTDGGYVASVEPDGSPRDTTRYAYEQAFALLGLAWHARLFRDGEAARRADALWQWLEANLGDRETGGFLMGTPLPTEPRSQNPHMHLFEACLDWHEVAYDPLWLNRARVLYGLFVDRFFDRRRGVVREFFAADLTPTDKASRRIDVGHQAEWIWLLARYAALTGEDVSGPVARLHRFLDRHGRNPETGLLYEEVSVTGRPLAPNARLWSATELLKAELARYEARGRTGSTERIAAAVDVMFERHLDPVRPGLWMDKVAADGAPLSTSVPASSFYHLFLAFAELHRVAAAGPTKLGR